MVRVLVLALFLLAACGSSTPPKLTVTSPSFKEGAEIPDGYTCTGGSQVPDIAWSGSLHGAKAIALVVDDPDAPSGTFTHRIVLDLPPTVTHLSTDLPAGAHQANNSSGQLGWTPPCPPSGTHHYRFTVYALSKLTGLPDGTPPDKALKAITSTTVAEGRLTGLVKHEPNR
jgi:Raf kinase inhibitor-like YbhB/YbcL family protein